MGRCCSSFVLLYTAASVCGLAWRIDKVLPKSGDDRGAVAAAGILRSLFQSSISTALLANLLINLLAIATLSTKAFFFGQLSLLEIQKLVERLINYAIFKGLFLALIAQPDMMQIALWLVWFSILGFLKVFQGLAKDRLERLHASPAATVVVHGRVFIVLVLVLLSSFFWIQLCVFMFKDSGINLLLLLLFDPLSLGFDTLQAILVHGIQLHDTWWRCTMDEMSQCRKLKPSERSAAAAAWEWRGTIVQNCSFIMDVVSYLLALGHCLHLWWLRGLAFKVADGVLFLNLRTLLSAILKRIKGFMRVRTAMSTLQGALPDATEEELLAYDDDCAICKEPMAKAKQLPCSHLFHLPCLRSWLDQGLAEAYSCPTCRRPLFMGSGKISPEVRQQFVGEQARRFAGGTVDSAVQESYLLNNLSQRTQSSSTMQASFTNQPWDAAFEQSWGETQDNFPWSNAFHGDGSSSAATGHSRSMQTVVHHLTGNARSQSPSEGRDMSWGWWPFPHRMGEMTSTQPAGGLMSEYELGNVSNSRLQSGQLGARREEFSGTSRMREMVNTVKEVLPDIPEDLIIEDLRRTNSVTATVNNLL